ncbi:hypothetical protein [Streptomyces lichenis]|uniref:MFS transporter n=1 Tax=Streptomyces lichenis TaxID=2306967 RepID=A0ABT0ICX5_9ACTN|nr:hypothetical protein [Streptomyces lichenis]MCK8679182.1 hypothetical protein [Streptomyces lichenis]
MNTAQTAPRPAPAPTAPARTTATRVFGGVGLVLLLPAFCLQMLTALLQAFTGALDPLLAGGGALSFSGLTGLAALCFREQAMAPRVRRRMVIAQWALLAVGSVPSWVVLF